MDMSWLLSAVIVVVVLLAGVAWVADWISRRAAARRHAGQNAQRAICDAQRMEESYRVLDQRVRELANLPLWRHSRKEPPHEKGDPDKELVERRRELMSQIEQASVELMFRPQTVRDAVAALAATARDLGRIIEEVRRKTDWVIDAEIAPEEKARHEAAVAAVHAAQDRFIGAARLDLGVE